MSRYPPAALKLAAALQRDLAAGELLAVDSFARAGSALALLGAPLDLIGAAVRVSADEVRHADYNLQMLSLLESRPLEDVRATVSATELKERARVYDGRPRTYEELDLWMLEVPALGETIACALLLECAEHASDTVVRALFRSVAADEVHHARLGWYYLAWRRPQWTDAERQRLANRAAQLADGVLPRFGVGRELPPASAVAARALGVLDTASQHAAVQRTLAEELVPGFDALGFGTSRRASSRRSSSRSTARHRRIAERFDVDFV